MKSLCVCERREAGSQFKRFNRYSGEEFERGSCLSLWV